MTSQCALENVHILTDTKSALILQGTSYLEMQPPAIDRQKLSILAGSSNFNDHILENVFFIDKSMFIRDFMEGPYVSVILRPRRFGKSTNLSMLKNFLALGSNIEKFKDLLIKSDVEFCNLHCGKYPVVCLDFKDCDATDWESMQFDIWDVISAEALFHITNDNLKIGKFKLSEFEAVEPPKCFATVLRDLTISLHEKHGEKVIILIDEYETPLINASKNGFYVEASCFFENLYTSALKGNDCVKKACLMGIVEVRDANISSRPNNSTVFSVSDEMYSEYFGFTMEEIAPYAGNELESVLSWYNGYTIGGHKLINPWSFTQWLLLRKLDSYWIGSANIEGMKEVLKPLFKDVLFDALAISYLDGFRKPIKTFSTAITFGNQPLTKDSIWLLLIHTGYLTYESGGGRSGFAYVPNLEIREHWQTVISDLLDNDSRVRLNDARSELGHDLSNFKYEKLGIELRKAIQSASCHDLIADYSFHILCFEMLYSLFLDVDGVNLISNLESADGRLDIAIEFTDISKVIIIELKKSCRKIDLERDAEIALDQIKNQKYTVKYRGFKILLIGVSFFKKYLSPLKVKILRSRAQIWNQE